MFAAEPILKRFESLKSERMFYEAMWSVIAKVVMPDKDKFMLKFMPWATRYTQLDSSALLAAERMAAALKTYMCNEATQWFELEAVKVTDFSKFTQNQQQEISYIGGDLQGNQKEAQLWLEAARDALLSAYSETNCNFYDNYHSYIHECGVLGTSAILIESGREAGIPLRTKAVSLNSLYLAEDAYKKFNTVFNQISFKYEQLLEKGELEGWNITEEIRQQAKNNPDEYRQVVQAIFPRKNLKPGLLLQYRNLPPQQRQFACVWVDCATKHIYKETGYFEKPIIPGRWSEGIDETYGIGRGQVAFGDTMSSQSLKMLLLEATEIAVKPAIQLPNGKEYGVLDLGPGGLNYTVSSEGKMEVINQGGNLPAGEELLLHFKDTISKVFYDELYAFLSEKDMTATEVEIRAQQTLGLIAPNTSKQSKHIGEIIETSLKIMIRNGDIPPPPLNTAYRVKYVSPITRAQRYQERQGIVNFITTVLQLSQAKPDLLDNIDLDVGLREVADIDNIPSKMVRTSDQVEEIRSKRAEMENAQMALNAAQQGATVMKELSQAAA